MQAQATLMTTSIRVLAATLMAAALAAVMMVPAAQATTITEVSQATVEDDAVDDPSEAPSTNPSLDRDQILFLEFNWHLDAAVLTADESDTDNNPAGVFSTRDLIEALEHNWYLDVENITGATEQEGNPTEASESDLWLLEEPRMQQLH